MNQIRQNIIYNNIIHNNIVDNNIIINYIENNNTTIQNVLFSHVRQRTHEEIEHLRRIRDEVFEQIEEELIHSLKKEIKLNPPVKYETIKNPQNTECAISTETFKPDDMVYVLNCNHIFTAELLKKWCDTHDSCPLCRTKI